MLQRFQSDCTQFDWCMRSSSYLLQQAGWQETTRQWPIHMKKLANPWRGILLIQSKWGNSTRIAVWTWCMGYPLTWLALDLGRTHCSWTMSCVSFLFSCRRKQWLGLKPCRTSMTALGLELCLRKIPRLTRDSNYTVMKNAY